MPKVIENLKDLEKISRMEHRLIPKNSKEIWHKDKCYVFMEQNHMSDDEANKWLGTMKFKVVSEDEAYPNRKSELKKALDNEPQMSIKS